MARLIAKTVVDADLAARCQVAISYAIGKADPVAFSVDTLGTGQYSDQPDRLRHRHRPRLNLPRRLSTHQKRLGRTINKPDTPICYLAQE